MKADGLRMAACGKCDISGARTDEVVVQITRRNRLFGQAPESVHATYEQGPEGHEVAVTIERDEFSLAATTTEEN